MSVLIASRANPFERPPSAVWRFTVDDYHRMIASGVLGEDDRVELLEGWIVPKMTHHPPHDGTIQIASERLRASLIGGWVIRIQSAVTTGDSEPEPDIAVVRGNERTYIRRHPGPEDVGLIVEVADSSLEQDRKQKSRIYARARIPVYWIINLVDCQVEIFGNAAGVPDAPHYASHRVFRGDDLVPLMLDGQAIAPIRAGDLLPE